MSKTVYIALNASHHALERTDSSERVLVSQSSSSEQSGRAIKHERRSMRGFTMVEVISVIAIMAIVAAVAFVSFTELQKNLQQKELNETAKELFIAAQNHLSASDTLGYLEQDRPAGLKFDLGTQATEKTADGTIKNMDGVYYFAVDNYESYKNTLLGQMLPFGSIDDTVLKNGTYVIRYDTNSGTVLDVFFAWKNRQGLFSAYENGFAFTNADYDNLFIDPDYTGPTTNTNAQDHRRSYSRDGHPDEKVMIGYYGGEEAQSLIKKKLGTASLEIVNAERLYAKVTYTAGVNDAILKPVVDVVVTGATSNATKTFRALSTNSTTNALQLGDNAWVQGNSSNEAWVLFDDITTGAWQKPSNRHFAKLFEDFLPGEDIRVQAIVRSTSTDYLATTVKSRMRTCNSLFDSISAVATGSGSITSVIYVSNIRHLENLSGLSTASTPENNVNNISGYDVTDGRWGGKAPMIARQRCDLKGGASWDGFCAAIGAGDAKENKKTVPFTSLDLDTQAEYKNIQISTAEGYTMGSSKGSFLPVIPKFNLTYEGGYNNVPHSICNVVIDVPNNAPSGNAGLFGDLASNPELGHISISNLELVNFTVDAKGGNAGTVAGATSGGTTIANVLAYNDTPSDSAYVINGTSDVGGLVGSMSGGSISQSAAAVRVRSSSGNAGGLVGSVSDSGSITASYSGGHTSGGAYPVADNANVIASGSAGGLVGTLAGSITASYSTCSVNGATAGGLVGTLSSGSIGGSSSSPNCYATGKVDGSTKGALVGSNSAGPINSSCYYFDLVNSFKDSNGKLAYAPVVGTGDSGGTAADAKTDNYKAISGSNPAIPYDTTAISKYSDTFAKDANLGTAYAGKYPFATVSMLLGATGDGLNALPWFVKAHYGDWPVLETLVLN